MIPFTIKSKKVTSNKFAPEIFNSYDPFYYNKQKGTSNKFAPEIFNSYDTLYFVINKRNKQ